MAPSQSFFDHVKELQWRLLWIILAIGLTAGMSYVLRVQVIRWLQRPLGATLFYTSPAGSFNFILKLSTLIGLFVALPVIIYQLLRFIEPALPVKIKKTTMLKIISASFAMALGGMAFGYFYMIPTSLHFFAGYATDQIKPLISANEYLSYILGNLIIFALVFQIPLIVLFINWIKPTRPKKLLRYQRHVIVGAFGIAIILPFTYDPISQFIVAIPIIFLFYLSVALLWVANRKRTYPDEILATASTVNEITEPQLDAPPTLVLPPAVATNTMVPKKMFYMDGIIRQHGKKPAAQQPTATTTLQLQQAVDATPVSPSKPRLSIDGVHPPLPSSV